MWAELGQFALLLAFVLSLGQLGLSAAGRVRRNATLSGAGEAVVEVDVPVHPRGRRPRGHLMIPVSRRPGGAVTPTGHAASAMLRGAALADGFTVSPKASKPASVAAPPAPVTGPPSPSGPSRPGWSRSRPRPCW